MTTGVDRDLNVIPPRGDVAHRAAPFPYRFPVHDAGGDVPRRRAAATPASAAADACHVRLLPCGESDRDV
jgi:hypothetical protein